MSRDSEQPWILCTDVVVACPAGCDEPTLEVERRQLMFLLEGLKTRPADSPAPVGVLVARGDANDGTGNGAVR